MSRYAIFVDAGYLFAAGSTLLTGANRPRGELRLDNERVISALVGHGRERSGGNLLRVYWYDGTSSGPTASQLALANMDDVKLRLGLVNSSGEQKGVDSLIITDMIALARNRAMSDAILLGGDEDLRVGVQQAQEHGVRVHLLGIAPSDRNQSQLMRQEVDTRREWDADTVRGFLTHERRLATPPVPPQFAQPVFAPVIVEVVGLLDPSELAATLDEYASTRGIPQDVDRRLLTAGSRVVGRVLDQVEKQRLRGEFIDACRRAVATPPPAADDGG